MNKIQVSINKNNLHSVISKSGLNLVVGEKFKYFDENPYFLLYFFIWDITSIRPVIWIISGSKTLQTTLRNRQKFI